MVSTVTMNVLKLEIIVNWFICTRIKVVDQIVPEICEQLTPEDLPR